MLGFSLYDMGNYHIKKIQQEKVRNFVRRTTNLEPKIGIDMDRLLNRLQTRKIIDKDNEPRHAPQYIVHKSWEIVRRFRQITEGLFNYYYYNIQKKSLLNRIYYLLKYSCYKTIENRKKISIQKIIKKYGPELKITYKLDDQEKTEKFPKYNELMNKEGKLAYARKIKEITEKKNKKDTVQCPADCHQKIHKGIYDGIALKDVYRDFIIL